MTCKDCIHYDRCYLIEHFGADEEETCKDFKNKADFMEVCRCEKCKYWHYTGKGLMNERIGICTNDYFPFHCEQRAIMRETDFCSYGERRDT